MQLHMMMMQRDPGVAAASSCRHRPPVTSSSRRRPWQRSVAAAAHKAAPARSDAEVLLRITQQFEDRAAAYDADNVYHPSLAQRLLQLCALQPGESLLDLGAGTGFVGLAAAPAVGGSGSVVMVDVSQAMLDQARSKHVSMQQQLGVCPDVHLIIGDIEDLHSCLPPAWQPGCFDAITCSAATPFLRQPAATLAAWRRWLKQPGGRLCMNTFVPPALEDFETFQRLAAGAGLPPVVDPCEQLGSVELVTSLLTAAGYSQIEVFPEAKERWMPAASVEAYAAGIWVTALTRNPFMPPGQVEAALGPAALEGLRQQFITAVAAGVEAHGRLDNSRQCVLNQYTVLHVLAQACE